MRKSLEESAMEYNGIKWNKMEQNGKKWNKIVLSFTKKVKFLVKLVRALLKEINGS